MAQFDKWLEFLQQLVSGTKQDGTTAPPPGEVPTQPPLSGAPPQDIPPAPSGVPPVPPSGSAGSSSSAEQAQQPDPKSPWSNLAPMLAQLIAQQGQGGKGGPDMSSLFSGLLGDSGKVPSRERTGMDTFQTVLDVIGVADPSPIVDTINAGISLTRAIAAKDSKERNEHLVNAGISAVAGWVPYWGDTAKIPKFAKGLTKTVGESARTFKSQRSPGGSPPKVTPPTSTPASAGSPASPSMAGGFVPPGGGPLVPPTPPGAGAPPVPPIPPGGVPPIPPPPPPGGAGTPPSPGGGYSGALPFLVGAGAGAAYAFGSSGGSNRPQQYSLTRDTLGEDKLGMGKEAMSIMGNRGAELLEVLINPLQNPFTKLKNIFKAVDEIPSALMHWGDSLKDSQERLRMFNGEMAGAFIESDFRQIMRDFGSAQRTSASTAGLVKSLDNLKDELQPLKDVFTNLTNTIVSIGLKTAGWGIEWSKFNSKWDEGVTILNKIFSLLSEGDKAPVFEMWDSIKDTSDTRTPRPRI